MSEEMEKTKEVNLRYIEELFEMYRSADRNGELAKMIKSWDADWAKADAEFLQSNSKENVDKRRLLCVQALFLAESFLRTIQIGKPPVHECGSPEFFTLLMASNGLWTYRAAADKLMPEGDMVCLYARGRLSFQIASIKPVDILKARHLGVNDYLPSCRHDVALKDLLAADAIESSLENDFVLGQAYYAKGFKNRVRLYFFRVLTYNCESTLQEMMRAEAKDALKAIRKSPPGDEFDWMVERRAFPNETLPEKNKVEEKKKEEPQQVKKNNEPVRAQGGSEKVESKKRGGKDSSETAVVEKKRRPSRNVPHRPNYFDESD